MRFTILALLLVAGEARADRGHQAYQAMLDRDARRYEQWANKPCTPRGRFLVNVRHRVGTTTLWRVRLYTTGHWRITLGAFQITQTGCDRSRRRRVFMQRD